MKLSFPHDLGRGFNKLVWADFDCFFIFFILSFNIDLIKN
jgi:hypothetical protein